MVKPTLDFSKSKGIVIKLCLLTFLITGIIFMTSCDTKELIKSENAKSTSEAVSSVQSKSKIVGTTIKMFDRKKYELPEGFNIEEYFGNDEFLVFSDDRKSRFVYNIKTNVKKEIINSSNNAYEINFAKANANWIVWSEHEKPIGDLNGYFPFQWSIFAQNRHTGEKILIDKNTFKNREDYNLGRNTIDYLDISEDDILVYTKSEPSNKKVAIAIVAYDLKTREMTTVLRRESLEKGEGFTPPSIYKKQIIWSRYNGEVSEAEPKKHFMSSLYADLFVHNLENGKTTQITKNGFYHEAKIYGDKIIAIRFPDMTKNQSSAGSILVMFDINDNYKESVIVNKFSPSNQSHYLNDPYSIVNDETPENLIVSPDINSKYISYRDNAGDNRYLFDYKNNTFIQLLEMRLPFIPGDQRVDIRSMFENYVLVYVSEDEKMYLLDMETKG